MDIIYALSHPVTGEIRYVGKTGGGLHQRLLSHISDANKRKNQVRRFVWIRELQAEGLMPRIHALEEVDGSWQDAECKWIAKLKAHGCKLLNGTEGGDGRNGFSHSEAARQAISEKAKERYKDAAFRKKIGDAVRLGYSRPEARARLSAGLKIAFAKPEVKARLSAAQTLSKNRPEMKALTSRIHTGKIVSDETRRKLSIAKTGKKLSPASIANIAAGHRGLRHSEATKAKMRASALKRASLGSQR